MKKTGTIGYATESGLGVIISDFIRHQIFDDILIIRHEVFENHYDWYPNAGVISRNVNPSSMTDYGKLIEFLSGIDVLVLVESPWSPYVIPLARQLNKKIVLMANYEFTPWPLDVDMIICPSLLEFEFYQKLSVDCRMVYINIPVNSTVKSVVRNHAIRFLHNGGRGSSNDRNGTELLINSMSHCKSVPYLTVRSQKKLDFSVQRNVSLETGTSIPHEKLYEGYDVFVFIERFCGSSLPLQEAFASGMAVIAGDRFPINTWLPKALLAPVCGYSNLNFNGYDIARADYDPAMVARLIDDINLRDIREFSQMGIEWGDRNSWQNLTSQYQELLQSL